MAALEAAAPPRPWAVVKTAEIKTSPRTFFVHVRVPESIATSLREVQKQVVPDASRHQDIDHVTLVYTKKPADGDEHPPEKVHGALEKLRDVAANHEPIKAKIQGWGYFDGAQKDGKTTTALVALLDAPGLDHLHVDMSRALKEHGIEPAGNHIFTPHITIGYLEQHGRADKPLPPLSGTFTIDKAHVAARDHHEIPLTGASGLAKAAAAFAVREAATVDQLQAGFRRLAPTRVPVKTLARSLPRPDRSQVFTAAAGGGAALPPAGALKAMWGQNGYLEDEIRELLQAYPKQMRGQIFLPRGVRGSVGALSLAAPGVAPKNMSGAGQRATNVAVGLHEGFERGVKPSEVQPVFGHLSPKVLLNEHNMISRMTGPGSDEARNLFTQMRSSPIPDAPHGEMGHIRKRFVDYYGPRAEEFFQPGAKIPAAMRRDFVRRPNIEPTYAERTAIGPSTEGATSDKLGVEAAKAIRATRNGESRRDHHEIPLTGGTSLGQKAAAAVWRDKLPGGLADDKKPSDFDAKQLAKGQKHEREHTREGPIAKEIAMDHLSEDPKYYDKLDKLGVAAAEAIRR